MIHIKYIQMKCKWQDQTSVVECSKGMDCISQDAQGLRMRNRKRFPRTESN